MDGNGTSHPYHKFFSMCLVIAIVPLDRNVLLPGFPAM